MHSLISTILSDFESFISKPSRAMDLIDTVLDRFAPKKDGAAYPCWYEYNWSGCILSIGCAVNGIPGPKKVGYRRQCCCQSPVCGAYSCGPWQSYSQCGC